MHVRVGHGWRRSCILVLVVLIFFNQSVEYIPRVRLLFRGSLAANRRVCVCKCKCALGGGRNLLCFGSSFVLLLIRNFPCFTILIRDEVVRSCDSGRLLSNTKNTRNGYGKQNTCKAKRHNQKQKQSQKAQTKSQGKQNQKKSNNKHKQSQNKHKLKAVSMSV